MKTYGFCIVCSSSQKHADHPCLQCGSEYVIARDVLDYEVNLFGADEKPDVIPPNDPKYKDTPTALPPANHDMRPADMQVVDQERETWTRTGDPKTTRLTIWDKQVKAIDVDPKNFSTKNDGHEQPGDAPRHSE